MQLTLLKQYNLVFNKLILILLLIIFQSCGIRFLEGQGSLLAIVIFFLERKAVKNLKKKDVNTLVVLLIFLLINKVLNDDFQLSKLIYQYCLILESYFFLILYRSSSIQELQKDFYETLNLIFFYALVGWGIYLVAGALFDPVTFNGYNYVHLAYLFYFDAFGRNNSFLWEPGILQLMLNLFLFFSIKQKKKPFFLFTIAFVILSTGSTSGYIILCINYLFFLFFSYQNKTIHTIKLIVITLLVGSFSFIIMANINNKFDSENTSGLARYRDYQIGLQLINEKPLFGHGLFDVNYLKTKPYVGFIESRLFTSGYLETSGDMSGGFTNGLLSIFAWYGILAGLYIYFLVYKNKFVTDQGVDRFVFFLILVFAFISEPITYTAFFLLFPISYIIFPSAPISKTGKPDHNNQPSLSTELYNQQL